MKKGQRVMWNEDGSQGTIDWVTKRGCFAVVWDDGQFVEYTSNLQNLVTILK